MTASSVSVPVTGRDAPPGLRTFRSRRFREIVAVVLLSVGVAILGSAMVRQATDPRGQFAIDFADYHTAAQRLVATGSPYAPDMLNGPVPAQGQDRYRYPPPLAQVLVPLAGTSMAAAAAMWLALQAAALFAAVWIAGSVGGSERTRERVLWSAVATTWFLPAFDTLWKGNVSGFIALAVAVAALGGGLAGAAAIAATAVKLVPATLLPATFMGMGRRAITLSAVVAAGALAFSVVASPRAWADFAIVLPNLLTGSADYATNLAPATLVARAGVSDVLVTTVRVASLALAAAAIVASVLLARRRGGLPAAVVLAVVAMLLLPAALWYHYLCVLLPVGALAWRSAGTRLRAALVAGGVMVTAALAWLPLALAGFVLIVSASLRALWPSRA